MRKLYPVIALVVIAGLVAVPMLVLIVMLVVMLVVMRMPMVMIVTGMSPMAMAGTDPFNMVMMAGLWQTLLVLKSEDLLPVLAQLAVHQRFTGQNLVHPVRKRIEHLLVIVEVSRLYTYGMVRRHRGNPKRARPRHLPAPEF